MSKKYQVIEETLAYVTAEDVTNTSERYLTAGSQNMLINQQRKVVTRNGNTLYGAGDASLTPIRNGYTWVNSTGESLKVRVKNGVLQAYFETLGATTINAWTNILTGMSTSVRPRFNTWYKATEFLDLLVFVWSDTNLYAWGGGAAVVASLTSTTVTKNGTETWAEDRFFTTGNKTLVCVRTGTEYTYTGGESTTTLTGIADTTGIIAGDILVQKVVTTSNKPTADMVNNTVYTYQNQLCVGSDTDQTVYVSKNTDYTNFAYSAPRVPGEGALFTLDGKCNGIIELDEHLVIFSGKDSIYKAVPKEITVGSTLTETFAVEKFQVGINQSAQSQDVIQVVGSKAYYLSFEPAFRELPSPLLLAGGSKPQTLSNPIKPDFDAEDWTNAASTWYKNAYYLSAPTTGRLYILEFREDADGKLRRFWQTPQIMSINAFSAGVDALVGHSSVVGESYTLFDSDAFSDIHSGGEKLPIHYIAAFSYRNYGERVNMKTFDEYFVEGEISPSTAIDVCLRYDYGGNTQELTDSISGADTDILLETLIQTSLAQQPLGQHPLGGSIEAPSGTAKFRKIFEFAREDFVEIQDIYESNDTDQYWSIIARGANAQISRRQNIKIKG